MITAETRAKMSEGAKRAGCRPPVLVGEENPKWKGNDVGYDALHAWLVRHHPKTGTCEECRAVVGTGRDGTDYAFLRHPEAHTRERDDYRELCRKCHRALDNWLLPRGDAHWTRRRS